MVSSACRKCKQFLSNDCAGLSNLDEKSCQEKEKKRNKEVDVSGCC